MEILDIHPATADERLQAVRNVFDVWPVAPTIEEHVERRLNSPPHNRPAWFVGCLGERVVSSLACHDTPLTLRGEVLPGIAIASVHTVAEFRGRGFAPQLLDWVEQDSRNRGVQLSLLYSDVGAAYYGRLGYVECPAFEGWLNPSTAEVACDSEASLVEFCGPKNLNDMARLYAGYHETAGIAIHRPREYWQYTFVRFPNDRCFWLVGADESRLGYVRLTSMADGDKIADFALARPADGLAEQLYAALIRMCREQKTQRLGGWLPDFPITRQLFDFRPRQVEITMLKSLATGIELDDVIAATHQFCELDHV